MTDYCIDFPCCGHGAGECREAQHEMLDHLEDIIADVWEVPSDDDDDDDDAAEWDGDDYSDYYDDIYYGADDYW